jgi:ATP-dependent helicase HrpB
MKQPPTTITVPTLPTLPVTAVMDDIRHILRHKHELILQAPPGAGKTTLVPLALLDEPWLAGQKILVLEPRRLAARNAAHRMAFLMGEKVGETIGHRMRMDTKVGPATRIEVITEGILTRMLLEDPSLTGVGAVLFDEFHERSLDCDLGLALTLQGRELFREGNPLKIIAMSATLDSEALASLLSADVVTSQGRQFPVELTYTGPGRPRERIAERAIPVILQAIASHPNGSLLVFLPGQGEIHAVTEALSGRLGDPSVQVRPLYGNLSIESQQAAISPEASGGRKIVLATNIAETSLTIEGVDVVVDCGLARAPQFDPNTGMTRLHTVRISQASALQRAGRAGRLAPGHCYRLWSRDQHSQLAPHHTPEITNADLAPLALQLLQWGVKDPAELKWLDVPPKGAWLQALELLQSLGAVNHQNVLTAHGEVMAGIAAHPRLAHMMLRATGEAPMAATACLLAAVLSDRDPFTRTNPDMMYRLSVLTGEMACPGPQLGWLHRTRELARQFDRGLPTQVDAGSSGINPQDVPGYLIACAYPDRIARRRHAGGFQLANGRSAVLERHHHIGKSRWLAVAETGGTRKRQGDTIYSAAVLNPELLDSVLAHLVKATTVAEWDEKAGRFTAERQTRVGNLVLTSSQVDPEAGQKLEAVLQVVRRRGPAILPFTDDAIQLRARIELARRELPNDDWPDLSDERDIGEWLGPFLGNVSKRSDFRKLDMLEIIQSQLTWAQRQVLDRELPARLEVPSGSRYRIDYTRSPPTLAVKLQEMFGATQTPAVAGGRVNLMLHLLSPAGRPLQITQDLAGFWSNSYADVKKEMKGRYPKHPWPDDPRSATPTGKTKKAR